MRQSGEVVRHKLPHSFRILMMNFAALLAVCTNTPSWAVPIEKTAEGETFVKSTNGVIVITTDSETYTVASLPITIFGMESAVDPVKLKRKKIVKNLDYGADISQHEIEKVIDIYYKNSAYDYESIRLRNISIGYRQFITYCSTPVIWGICDTGWVAVAGVPVFFDADGRNLSGGKTGYARVALMIRKVEKSIKP